MTPVELSLLRLCKSSMALLGASFSWKVLRPMFKGSDSTESWGSTGTPVA